MKHLKLIPGFILASCLFLLISAKNNNENSENEIPRYHITWTNADAGIVYDAVTGKFKTIKYKDLTNGNIKVLLDRVE